MSHHMAQSVSKRSGLRKKKAQRTDRIQNQDDFNDAPRLPQSPVIESHEVQQLKRDLQMLRMQMESMSESSWRGGGMAPKLPQNMAKNLQIPKLGNPEEVQLPEFETWLVEWQNYVCLTDPLGEASTSQWSYFLRMALHVEWITLWRQGELNVSMEATADEVIKEIKHFIVKKVHPADHRHRFFTRKQRANEGIREYMTSLKTLEAACTFPALHKCTTCGDTCMGLAKALREERVRDQFVEGLYDKDMREQVLAQTYEDYSLDKVKNICLAKESCKASSMLEEPSSLCKTELDDLNNLKGRQSESRQSKDERKCWNCGKPRHPRNDCPAQDATCRNCNKKGHFAKCCRRPLGYQGSGEAKMLDEEDVHGMISIGSLCKMDTKQLVQMDVQLNNQKFHLNFLPDTGASVNAVGIDVMKRVCPGVMKGIQREKRVVRAVNGQSLYMIGFLEVKIVHNSKEYKSKLFIFKDVQGAILSQEGCKRLGLISRSFPHCNLDDVKQIQELTLNQAPKEYFGHVPKNVPSSYKERLLQEYKDVFDDERLKVMTGSPMHIELDEKAVPVRRYKPYTVPLKWQGKVKSMLDDMERTGIIEKVPVGETVTWLHAMVVVPKKNSVEPRIAIDFSPMNRFVKRPAHPLVTPRDAVSIIPPGMIFFTVLDMRHGFWQVALDESSKRLTSFMTMWGTYRFNRNAMGLTSAGDEYIRRGDEALREIDNVVKVVDDILIFDQDYEMHCRRVQQVLDRCRKNGITLHPNKIHFAQPVVEFCGYTISKDGFSTSQKLVEALKRFPVPKSKTDVRSFCGLAQQFEKFTPRLTELLQPLRALTSTKTSFVWEGLQKHAFEDTIQALTDVRLLAHYDPDKRVRLETDAAQSKGLGYALWQEQTDQTWRLLQCGSREVNDAESKYSATEIELLALTWAIKKCHLFLQGSWFEAIVDHKPLVSIVNKKQLCDLETPRQKRLMEKLMAYQLTVSWKPGIKHVVVDCLSRYPVSQPDSDDMMDTDDIRHADQVFQVMANEDEQNGEQIVGDMLIDKFRSSFLKDPECMKLARQVKVGFPDNKQQLDEELHKFWTYRHQLSLAGDMILLGTRLFVPKDHRKEVLGILHAPHLGIEKTQKRARQVVFWPGITNDIRNLVTSCKRCIQFLPSQAKEPLKQENPSGPMEVVYVDLFSADGYEYLVMSDKYSGWPMISALGKTGTSSAKLITILRNWFSAFGFPRKLVSDGGPQLRSAEFTGWLNSQGVYHFIASSYYPQSNGQAEAAVKTLKHFVMKVTQKGRLDSDAFYMGLAELRNSPRLDGPSPAQLMFGRQTRTLMPVHPSALYFKEEKDSRAKEKYEEQYNRRSRQLPQLPVGAKVWVQNPKSKRWDTHAVIVEQMPGSRSYKVKADKGGVYHRNRRHIRPDQSSSYSSQGR